MLSGPDKNEDGRRFTVSRDAVGAALVAYGRELERDGAAQVGESFSGDSRADALLRSDPNAFLLAVLFTQGIPAERAWRGPYELSLRLGGNLCLEFLAAEPQQVLEAFQRPPVLHRFKNTLPRWISSAAQRLIVEYDGSAANIWLPGTHVLDVTERLAEFDGIGRKKSVMTVEILTRTFGVELEGRECGQIAYDVQVRRVFLRSGLIECDTLQAVEAAASEFCPDAPGTLDLATWLVGRETCRPRSPRCDACKLGDVCPRLVRLNVEGVGARSPY